MKKVKVSPRNEELMFGDDIIKFSEIVKYSGGVVTTIDGTPIALSALLDRLSVVNGKLALDGVVVDTVTDTTSLQTEIDTNAANITALNTSVTNLGASIASKTNIFRQSSIPSGALLGDMWHDTDNDILSIYTKVNGVSTWMEV